jgi:prepilin peptidase CpaA
MHIYPAVAAVALLGAGVALVTDLRRGKIYNWLTLPLLALGPLLQTAHAGWAGLGVSLLALLLVAAVLGGLCVLAGPGLGGGDIKLLLALGAVLGWPDAGWLLLYTALASPVLAIPAMLRRRIFWQTCHNLACNLARRRLGERGVSVAAGSSGPRLPYAVCILLGTLGVVLRGLLF